MPFARFAVEVRTDARWETIPARYRATAKALYLDMVLLSAEMLLDGRLSFPVITELCDVNGHRNARRLLTELARSAHVEEERKGVWIVMDWAQFHSSRRDVLEQRKQAAERKRRSRTGQTQLEVTGDVTPGHKNGVTPGQERPSRAHTRASTASASDSITPPTPSLRDNPRPAIKQAEAFIRNGGYELTDSSLEAELEQRGITEDERHPLRDLAADLRTDATP